MDTAEKVVRRAGGEVPRGDRETRNHVPGTQARLAGHHGHGDDAGGKVRRDHRAERAHGVGRRPDQEDRSADSVKN